MSRRISVKFFNIKLCKNPYSGSPVAYVANVIGAFVFRSFRCERSGELMSKLRHNRLQRSYFLVSLLVLMTNFDCDYVIEQEVRLLRFHMLRNYRPVMATMYEIYLFPYFIQLRVPAASSLRILFLYLMHITVHEKNSVIWQFEDDFLVYKIIVSEN
jgi:hypothetical protein